MSDWPDWWDWPLQFSDHLLLRMRQRNFNEAELRAMTEDASEVFEDKDPDAGTRWSHSAECSGNLSCSLEFGERITVVVTAFQVG